MQHWSRKKGMMGDDPPYLTVGTEVSAKYKGAFCEAKVRKVVRSVKCKVTFKLGLGSAIITDDQIRGTLRVGSVCEVKHPDKKEFVEATINKIQDCSQYTVVFDDGDITTLRRTALCLKSGRHFAESETLDQLPLTHPEHFGNPVIGGRKGRRSRQTHDNSSDDEDSPRRGKRKEEKEADIGKVVCVELGDKKKQKDNWFPGLVVAPTAQDTVRIRVREEYLVRSFKDGRYFTVPKKEATEFTREIGAKVDNNTLRTAVEKALLFLDRDELPPHWDRDLLFGMDESSGNSDSDGGFDSDSSDDEPREEKDHFVAQLYKFMDDRGTPINKGPIIGNKDVDLYKLFKVVHKLGGYNRVTNQNQWKIISHKLGFGQGSSSIVNLVKQAYKKFLHSFEDFYRKLGCTMVNHPRGNRSRHRSGRSLIRDRDRATPINSLKDKEKPATPAAIEKVPEVLEKDNSQTDKKDDTEKRGETEKKEKLEETPKQKCQKKDKHKQREEKADVSSKEEKKSEKVKAKDVKDVKGEDMVIEKSKVKEEKPKTSDTIKDESEEKEERLRVRESHKDDKGKEVNSRVALEDDSSSSSTSKTENRSTEESSRSRLVPNPVTQLSQNEPCSEEKLKQNGNGKQKPKDTKAKKEEKLKTLGERARIREEKSETKQKDEKVKEEKSKTLLEEEKLDEAKKKPEKKEDEEKQTRSKSKEDLRQKKDTVTPDRRPSESRTPVRESEKRVPPRPKKEEEMVLALKKRGRKRKDTDDKSKSEESMGQLASYISVGVGDKLKVYYGPTHESKVTYEAKASKPVLGKRGRPSVCGRTPDVPNVQHQPPRSTTPSSVTSSSSRTKSPAASASASRSSGSSRITRNTSDPNSMVPGPLFRRRTRRMSGHTDISMPSESESEEYESEVEIEIEPTQTRSRTEKRNFLAEKEEAGKDISPKEDVKKLERPFRRKAGKRKEEEDDEDKESSREDDSIDLIPDVDAPIEVLPSSEKRRSKRTKKMSVTPIIDKKPGDVSKFEVPVKQEPGTESEEEQPKGRDFDLNQIRSELKGIEKAVKLSQDVMHRGEQKCSQVILDDKTGLIDVRCKSEEKEEDKEVQSTTVDGKVPEKTEDPSAEDIYEFKEPEPFEFEVRSKRDTLLDERAGKLNRRLRIFDDVVGPKEEKSLRKKLIRSTVAQKTEGKDDTPFEGEVKKRFKRSITKKVDTVAESKRKEMVLTDELKLSPAKSLPSEPVTPQKSRPLLACEEAFDKLCESPSFHVTSKPCENRASSPLASKAIKPLELEPLSLFSELPGEGPDDDGEDDSEDRLVISETDETETETEEPLFTYPQRHHEELFPTLVSSESSVPAPEPTIAPPKSSPEPPQLLPMVADIFTSFSSGKNEDIPQRETENKESENANEQSSGVQMSDDEMKLLLKSGEDDEYEDDPINAAIQRVIEQSMTDEESDDMDIFGGKRPVCNIGSIQQESMVAPELEPPAAEVPRNDSLPKETGKRKTGSRKPVLSKEFVEDTDSDSDSSDEEERLVIAKIDNEDDNMSSSSSQCSLKLHVSESSDFEIKLRLSDRDEDSKTEGEESERKPQVSDTSLHVTTVVEKDIEDTGKNDGPAETSRSVDEGESTATVKTDEVTTSVQDVGHTEFASAVVAESNPSQRMECISLPNSNKVSEEGDVDILVSEQQTPVEKSDESEKCEEEAESNLRSLLCEETIPGSPAPASDSAQAIEICNDEPEETKTTVLEMPFASAPGSNSTSSSNNGKSSASVPIFASPSVVEPPVTTIPVTVDLSAPVQMQTVTTAAAPTVSPLLPRPPQVQVQVQVQHPAVPVAGPGPGSGIQGSGPGVSKRNSNEAAPVMDNTPPTTPDSSLSTISGSPREERDGMSPTLDNESSKSHRDSFEIDLDSCAEGNKVDHYSEEDSLLNIDVSNSSENRLRGLKLLPKKPCSELDKEMDSSRKKRRRSRKRSDCESNKRSRHSSGRSVRNIGGGGGGGSGGGGGGGGGGSDSDDTSENSTAGGCTPLTSSETVLSSRSPRPSKYNFYVELDPELDGTQRIALLQQKLQELRKTYINVKAELACIDRRRKKLRRREREERSTKQEVVCS
ncbi:AT-rich interactive domain-containing protein 4B isoform X2 [Zootermopsis nevadensis]|uniref:AT-rich interactive domain-containing protein 4B isoform X2 n=1 Tax=Zootermopsis nevadensis TaxID=136037 RepID=UPI000B8EE72C|nr:AT-rich interactive domain-containing protein 4B isoform X2 [Zootermopsis nevadensis]